MSIITLEFFLKAASVRRTKDQSPTNWGNKVHQRLPPPTVSLHNYGVGELPIVAQVRCRLSRGLSVDSQLQVQRNAAVDALHSGAVRVPTDRKGRRR